MAGGCVVVRWVAGGCVVVRWVYSARPTLHNLKVL